MNRAQALSIVTAVLGTNAPRATILIRLAVGLVFLSEGILKLLQPSSLGPGRFQAIGFPMPTLLAYFVACVEIGFGLLIVLGFLTRPAGLVLAVNISVAILSTKVPILVGHGYWIFHVRELSQYGFWAMTHESRTDFAMLLGSLFLLIVGGGLWSLDAYLDRHGTARSSWPSKEAEP